MVRRLFALGLVVAMSSAPVAAEICTALCRVVVRESVAPHDGPGVAAVAQQHQSVETSGNLSHHHHSASKVRSAKPRFAVRQSAAGCQHADGLATESREVVRGTETNATAFFTVDLLGLRVPVAVTNHVPTHSPPVFLHPLSPLRI